LPHTKNELLLKALKARQQTETAKLQKSHISILESRRIKRLIDDRAKDIEKLEELVRLEKNAKASV
jgi:hypothetical protein